MGRAKQEELDRQDRIAHAISLCVSLGAIKECDVHEGTYIDQLEYSDPEDLTAALLDDNPDALGFFSDRDDMVDCVRDAMQAAGDECPSCSKAHDS